ncbi:unnamed protein product [Symbiodinium sp. CCMP2592]|nr:unnamed protein product [Symbiodinium sp. CCMP2592]
MTARLGASLALTQALQGFFVLPLSSLIGCALVIRAVGQAVLTLLYLASAAGPVLAMSSLDCVCCAWTKLCALWLKAHRLRQCSCGTAIATSLMAEDAPAEVWSTSDAAEDAFPEETVDPRNPRGPPPPMPTAVARRPAEGVLMDDEGEASRWEIELTPALRISLAVGEALAAAGREREGLILTHLPYSWRNLTNVTVEVRPMVGWEQDHPGALLYSTGGPEEDEEVAASTATSATPGDARRRTPTSSTMTLSTRRGRAGNTETDNTDAAPSPKQKANSKLGYLSRTSVRTPRVAHSTVLHFVTLFGAVYFLALAIVTGGCLGLVLLLIQEDHQNPIYRAVWVPSPRDVASLQPGLDLITNGVLEPHSLLHRRMPRRSRAVIAVTLGLLYMITPGVGNELSIEQFAVPVPEMIRQPGTKADECISVNLVTVEILVWMKQEAAQGRPIDIACIQETAWKEDFEFCTAQSDPQEAQWFTIHSGGPNKTGILCLVRSTLLPADRLRHVVVAPGRLLHVRLLFETPLDILCIYQVAWNPGKATLNSTSRVEELLKQRAKHWNLIEQWLARTPLQHSTVLMGDLNTHFFVERTAGLSTHGERTQLDFVIVRASHADAEARKAMPSSPPFEECPKAGENRSKQGWQQLCGDSGQALAVTPIPQPQNQLSTASMVMRLWELRELIQTEVGSVRACCKSSSGNSGDKVDLRRFGWKRLQLRTPEGHLQTIEAEFQDIVSYYTQFYGGPPPTVQDRLLEPFNIRLEEVTTALGRLSPGKAMPSTSAPAALWQVLKERLAPYVTDQLAMVLRRGPICLPPAWCLSELILLPKPGKAMTSASQLRPICLLSPIAKVTASILAARLQPYAARFLESIPQFAYLGGRSLQQALDRVVSHCAEVRSLVAQQGRNPFIYHQGRETLAVAGGIQLSLDISKAYDCVPREDLQCMLQDAGVPSDLTSLIMAIHRQAVLRVQHSTHSADLLPLRVGLRQGCGLSPLLWAMFSGWVLKRLDGEGPGKVNIAASNTTFADDLHFAWLIRSGSALEQAYANIKAVLTHLAAHQLQVSVDKTVILIDLIKVTRLLCSSGSGRSTSSDALMAGVRTTVTQLLVQQARTIAKSYSMFTRETNASFMARLQVVHPVDAIDKALNARAQFDAWLCPALQPGQAHQHWLIPVDEIVHEIFECEQCGQQFATSAACKRHQFLTHMTDLEKKDRQEVIKESSHIAPMEHSRDGLPWCRHCSKKFNYWPNFYYHVNSRSCEGLRAFYQSDNPGLELASMSRALIERSDVLEFAKQCTWLDLAGHPAIRQNIQHCPECFHWVATPQYMKRHMKAKHPELAQLIDDCTDFVKASNTGENPCTLASMAETNLAQKQISEATKELRLIESLAPEGGRVGTPNSTEVSGQGEGRQTIEVEAPDTKGQGGRGKGHNQFAKDGTSEPSWGPPFRRQPEDNRSENQLTELQSLRNSVDLLTTLVLRHDNQLSINAKDTAYMIFVRTDTPGNLGAILYEAGKAWNAIKSATPEKLEAPMRIILMQKLLTTVLNRFTQLLEPGSKQDQAKQLGWMSEDGKLMNAMKCDMSSTHSSRRAVNRFHATRDMAETYASPTLSFMLDVGLRTKEAGLMWQHMNLLAHSSALSPATEPPGPQGCTDADERAQSWRTRWAPGRIDQVLNSRFNNRGNHCYTNALLKGLLFLDARGCRGSVIPAQLCNIMEGFLADGRAVTVWDNPFWRSMFRNWQAPDRQHDVAELLLVMGERCPALLQNIGIAWEARAQTLEGFQVLEAGCSMPLGLSPLAALTSGVHDRTSVQCLVDFWSQQEGLQAATFSPGALALQIGRFKTDEQGRRVHKWGFHVVPGRSLRFPVFSGDMVVRGVEYTPCSIVIHLGNTPDTGHYQAILLDERSDKFLMADDGQRARPCSEAELNSVYTNSYLFFYKRADEPA